VSSTSKYLPLNYRKPPVVAGLTPTIGVSKILPYIILLVFGFWFLVCYAATQIAIQLHQERIQVVCSNRVARNMLEHWDTYGQAQVYSKGHQGSSVDRPCEPFFHWIKFWHVQNPLPQSIQPHLIVLVLYWACQGERSWSVGEREVLSIFCTKLWCQCRHTWMPCTLNVLRKQLSFWIWGKKRNYG